MLNTFLFRPAVSHENQRCVPILSLLKLACMVLRNECLIKKYYELSDWTISIWMYRTHKKYQCGKSGQIPAGTTVDVYHKSG